MTVVLVLATFLVFILVDWALNRKKAVQTAPVPSRAVPVSPALAPAYVEGFLVPEEMSYHPGHGWALRERRNLVRVGVDEFAAALIGRAEKIEVPKPGQWVRQGQKVWSFYRNGEKTEMVSPTEGEIVEVNDEVLRDPSLLREDPYGKGWLATLSVPDEENTARNMVPKSMVRNWMRESVERLYGFQPRFAGAVAADGGRPADDVLADVPGADWKKITAEFFLTA